MPPSTSSFILYNTQTQQKEPFTPQGEVVRLYVCGPTVYDDAHLGHARCYLTWDILFRLLKLLYGEANVLYARNVTDVDDKIINKAKKEGTSIDQISTRYLTRFTEDMARLSILEPTFQPKATEHLEAMQSLVQGLQTKGHAYRVSDGSVYYEVGTFPAYGKLSRKPLEDQKAGARVEQDGSNGKRHPADFALWKAVCPSEGCTWESPWGHGRPGWHLECSAMIRQQFQGQVVDIHAGGQDLVFPHHENEVAQSEGCYGEGSFVRVWMHNGFVNVSGDKMSKSLGNFTTIRGLLERYNPNTVRYFILTNHYRMPVDFNEEALQASENWVKRVAPKLAFLKDLPALSWDVAQQRLAGTPFLEALLQDMNTPVALAQLNKTLQEAGASPSPEAQALLQAMLLCLGFDFSTVQTTASSGEDLSIPSEVMALLAARTEAKQAKDWAKADALRNEIQAAGYSVKDGPEGATLSKA
jgi:cysteinyl-tRNA synthetase